MPQVQVQTLVDLPAEPGSQAIATLLKSQTVTGRDRGQAWVHMRLKTWISMKVLSYILPLLMAHLITTQTQRISTQIPL